MKHLILVTSPPACGKTFVSKELAKALKPIVYLDKDTLIVLSKQIFKVANEEVNRSSQFFEDNIRNYEYDAIFAVGLEALEYCDLVLINAPFAREIRDPEAIAEMRRKLAAVGAELTVIWVQTDIEVCRQRMITRNSDRDTWKIEHWDEYIATQNFNKPDIDGLLIFNNSNEEEFKESIKRITAELKK
ncbi:MAG: AAA family ATPase [Oscillospiraceae bacterium]|nr:AAA family ATPase [Oscillospiraceae bacterium]MDY2846974.1 AAA family ATPase [Oscillospiraceae bacterium]